MRITGHPTMLWLDHFHKAASAAPMSTRVALLSLSPVLSAFRKIRSSVVRCVSIGILTELTCFIQPGYVGHSPRSCNTVGIGRLHWCLFGLSSAGIV